MGDIKDMVGVRVGRLEVVSRGPNRIEGKAGAIRATWLCRCDCGGEIVVTGHALRKVGAGHGGTKSCGCLARERPSKHGMARTAVYRLWVAMKQRCENPNHEAYEFYGGRGITVSERWRDFENFLADMGDRPAGMTIDRIDNSKGYGPDNCRWATRRQQSNNMRSNVRVSFAGKTMTIAEWGRETGLGKQAIISRLAKGWTIDAALTEPIAHNPSERAQRGWERRSRKPST